MVSYVCRAGAHQQEYIMSAKKPTHYHLVIVHKESGHKAGDITLRSEVGDPAWKKLRNTKQYWSDIFPQVTVQSRRCRSRRRYCALAGEH